MADPDDDFEDIAAVIMYLKKYAEELRGKGVPVDEMIRDLEEKLAAARAAAEKLRDLQAQDAEFEREKVERRRDLDAILAAMKPDLTDGMGTLEYFHGIAEREASRVRKGTKGRGG